MDRKPDFTTDAGVEVWRDITDEYVPCDLMNEPTDGNGRYVCAEMAERKYGDYAVCNYHFERAERYAADDARTVAAADADLARID